MFRSLPELPNQFSVKIETAIEGKLFTNKDYNYTILD